MRKRDTTVVSITFSLHTQVCKNYYFFSTEHFIGLQENSILATLLCSSSRVLHNGKMFGDHRQSRIGSFVHLFLVWSPLSQKISVLFSLRFRVYGPVTLPLLLQAWPYHINHFVSEILFHHQKYVENLLHSYFSVTFVISIH